MNKRATFIKSVVGGIVLGVLIGAGGAAIAADTVYTTWAPFTSNTTAYTARAYITPAGISGIQVKRSNGASSTQSYLGARVSEWRNGALVDTGDTAYNTSTVVAHIVQHPRVSPFGGSFQASGVAYAYNTATGGYTSKTIVKTPIQAIP